MGWVSGDHLFEVIPTEVISSGLLRGWRNTVEIVLFDISNSMKSYASVFHAYYAIKLRPVIGLSEPKTARRSLQTVFRQPLGYPYCIYIYIYIYICVYTYNRYTVSLSLSLSLSLYIYIYIYLSVSISICISLSLSLSIYIYTEVIPTMGCGAGDHPLDQDV